MVGELEVRESEFSRRRRSLVACGAASQFVGKPLNNGQRAPALATLVGPPAPCQRNSPAIHHRCDAGHCSGKPRPAARVYDFPECP